jgi:hypothetical protein
MGYFEALLAREVLEKGRRAEGGEDAYRHRTSSSARGVRDDVSSAPYLSDAAEL